MNGISSYRGCSAPNRTKDLGESACRDKDIQRTSADREEW